jgi:replicative DNA helicase
MIQELIFSQLLTNDEYARKVLPHLKEEYFSSQEEKIFFKIYSHFFTKHNKIPSKQAMLIEIEHLKASAEIYNTMKEMVGRTVEFEETLKYLVDKTEEYVKEKALFNALRESLLIADGHSKTKTAEAIPMLLQTALGVCFDTSVGHDYFSDAEARYKYYHETTNRVSCGIPEFDKITKNGFPKKSLSFILAPPHGGKSLVMSNIARGASQAGHNVLTITLEMSEMEFSKRYDVQLLDVTFDELAVLPQSVFESKVSKLAAKSRGRMITKEYPTKTAHCGHFRLLLEELRVKQNFVPDLIVVDYLGICASENYKPSSGANSYTIMQAVAEELRALSITHDCAIISAIQTNRSGIGNSTLDMSNIAESLGPAQVGDFIMAVIDTEDLKSMHQLLFIQIKNRFGGIEDPNKFMMGVDKSKMKLYSLDIGAEVASLSDKKKTKIETANDTFGADMKHTIKTSDNVFDFNFD